MRFIFADSPSKLQSYTEKGWLYFFLTQLQPNDRQAFVKFGLTERSLFERLVDYSSLNVANIYAIRMPCEEVFIREGAMKRIFADCKYNDSIQIWKDHGVEFVKGDLDLMLRVFLYFCSSSLDEANEYKTKTRCIDKDSLLSWLNALPSIETYQINKLSPWKVRKLSPEVQNILDVTPEMIRQIAVQVIVPSCLTETNEDSEDDSAKRICPKCGKELKDSRGVKIHMKSCTGEEKQFICPGCYFECANYNSLVVHKKRCKIIKKQILDHMIKEEQDKIQKELDLQKDRNIELESELQEMTEQYESKLLELEEVKKKLQSEYYNLLHLKDQEINDLQSKNKSLITLSISKDNKICELELLLEESHLANTRLQDSPKEEYSMFLESLSILLMTDISIWIQKSFYELGRYIGNNLKDHYHLEVESKDELYIMIHSDNNYNKKVSVKKLKHYLETIITPYILEEKVHNILDRAIESKIQKIKTMYKYIQNPTVKETEEIMMGLVSI